MPVQMVDFETCQPKSAGHVGTDDVSVRVID